MDGNWHVATTQAVSSVETADGTGATAGAGIGCSDDEACGGAVHSSEDGGLSNNNGNVTNEPNFDDDVINTQAHEVVEVAANSGECSGLDTLRTNPTGEGVVWEEGEISNSNAEGTDSRGDDPRGERGGAGGSMGRNSECTNEDAEPERVTACGIPLTSALAAAEIVRGLGGTSDRSGPPGLPSEAPARCGARGGKTKRELRRERWERAARG